MTNKLITSDIHLEDTKAAEYRFAIFEFIKQQVHKNNVTDVYILGDITDKKDKHSGKFINRIREEFLGLANTGCNIIVLLGNHDLMLGSYPTLKFLDDIHPNISFVTEYEEMQSEDGTRFSLVPFCMYDEIAYNQWWDKALESESDFILTHETFSGAVESNGFELDGPKTPHADNGDDVSIISGDVHVPQQLNNVIYVGSPFPVKFGDTFNPRCLLLDSNNEFISIDSVTHDIPKRMSITINSVEELETFLTNKTKPQDQVKVKVELDTSQVSEWSNIKQEIERLCEEYEVELHGVEMFEYKETDPIAQEQSMNSSATPDSFFEYYCEQEGIEGKLYEVGKELVSE